MISLARQGASVSRGGLIAIAVLLAASTFVPCDAGAAAPTSAAPARPSSAAPPASSSVDITYKETKPPQYPISAMEHEEQGLVLLNVKVDASGQVLNIGVDTPGTTAAKDLQDAAIAAVKTWQFNPGMKDGLPVGGVITVPISFGIARTCSEGYYPVGRPVSGYSCVPMSSNVSDKPGQCLDGFTYHQGQQKQYSCIPDSASPPPWAQ